MVEFAKSYESCSEFIKDMMQTIESLEVEKEMLENRVNQLESQIDELEAGEGDGGWIAREYEDSRL